MNEPRVVESVTNECQSLGRAHESSSARAEQLIACLEGEIAKRDEELAACRVAVENCEVFRVRIAELEDLVLSLQCKAIESDDLRAELAELAELAALKAQEPVGYVVEKRTGSLTALSGVIRASAILEDFVTHGTPLYAAPVSEAKAQDTVGEVVGWYRLDRPYEMTSYPSVCATWHKLGAPVAPLYADQAAPAADAGLVEALGYQVLFDAIAAATSVYANGAVNISVQVFRDALAAHRAKEVV